MRAPHLHSFRRDAPHGLFEIDFRSAHIADIAGTRHGQRKQLQRGTDGRPSVVFVDGDQEAAQLPFLGNGRAMIDDRSQEYVTTRLIWRGAKFPNLIELSLGAKPWVVRC